MKKADLELKPGMLEQQHTKEVEGLKDIIKNEEGKERRLREQLAELLRIPREHTKHISIVPWEESHYKEKEITWGQIFFALGELNSDANYSILLEEKERLQEKVCQLIRELDELKDRRK